MAFDSMFDACNINHIENVTHDFHRLMLIPYILKVL